MSISVMIPTYRRPDDLRRCLQALSKQSRLPDEVLVVVREDDAATRVLLDTGDWRALPLRIVYVQGTGLVHAMNAGLREIRTELVAITDDDAAPHADWVERIAATFERRPDVAGVGGRDLMYVDDVLQVGRRRTVGKIPRIGRHIGNHHLGFGSAREVDMLKGVNGAYRTAVLAPIGFDTRLRGSGAQIHWEISLGMALTRAGWKLIYDPQIVVDHFLARRFDEDQRRTFNAVALRNAAFNDGLVRMEFLAPFERSVYLGWAFLIGTRFLPGVVQWLRFVPFERGLAGQRLRATVLGRLDALAFLRRGKDARCGAVAQR